MSEAINRIAVLRDAILPAGAAQTRNLKALKHISKLNDEKALAMVNEIIEKQSTLRRHLEKNLRQELLERGKQMEPIKIRVLKYNDKDKKPIVTEIVNSLTSSQNIVGIEGEPAFIECVTLPIRNHRDLVAIMDDEGKLKKLPLVRGLYDDAGCLVDCIHGNFFVCAADFEEGFTSLDDYEIELVKNYFRDGDL